MADRRIFLLSSGRLSVYHAFGKTLAEPFSFEADEVGLTRFAVYLEENPPDPVYVVVDVVEEEFREETVPHVLGGDRRALLKTKSTRLFRDARYTHAVVQGREPDGRRDDRVLFSALIRPDLLAPWLGQIARHKIPLAGIYSLAGLAEQVSKRIAVAGEHVLLVTLQAGGGLRQSYLSNGKLKLSRLAIMPNLDPSQYASYILSEVEKIRRYLNSLRMVARESPIEVCLLSHGSLLEDLTEQTNDTISSKHHVIDLADCARKFGVRRWDGTPFSDRLFVQCVARTPPPNHYANPEERRYWGMFKARKLMRAASVCLIIGGIAFGGMKFFEGVIAGDNARSLAAQTVFYQDLYNEERARLPPAPAEPTELKQVVDAALLLEARRENPVEMLALISNGLTGNAAIELDNIAWTVSADPEAAVGGRQSRSQAEMRALRQRGVPEEAVLDPKVQYQIALISARLENFDGDFRTAIDTINEFVDSLDAQPSVEHVRVLSLPLDLSSQETLSGDTRAKAESARFEIRVALRKQVPDGTGEG